MAKAIDLTGQKFGRLTVLYRDPNKDKSRQVRWICQCECGNIKSYLGGALRSGGTVSCGCYGQEKRTEGIRKSEKVLKHCKKMTEQKQQHLEGQRFGKLVVLEQTDLRKGTNIIWKCQCDCGNIHYTTTNSLNKGDTKSCGCIKSYGEFIIGQLLINNNINFIKEYQFEDCIFPNTQQKAKFDFYINNQYLIEFDGQQHYKETLFFGELDKIQYRDTIKNQYCIEKNIPLIRIPYSHINEIILDDLLLETSKFIYKGGS